MSNMRKNQSQINDSFTSMLSMLENIFPKIENIEGIHQHYVNRMAEHYQKNNHSQQFIAQELFQYIPEKHKERINSMLKHEKEFSGLTFDDIISGKVEIKSFLNQLESTINENLKSIRNLEGEIKTLNDQLKKTPGKEEKQALSKRIGGLETEILKIKNEVSLKKSFSTLLKNDFFEILKSNLPSGKLDEDQRFQLIIDTFQNFNASISKKENPTHFEKFVSDNLDFLSGVQSLKNVKNKNLVGRVQDAMEGDVDLNAHETFLSQLVVPLIDLYYGINHFKNETVKFDMQHAISNDFSADNKKVNELQTTLLPNVTTRGVQKLKPLFSNEEADKINILRSDTDEYIKKRSSKFNTLRTFFGGVNRDHKVQLAQHLKFALSNCKNKEDVRQALIAHLNADYNIIQDSGKTHEQGEFANNILKALDTFDPNFRQSVQNPWNQDTAKRPHPPKLG